MALTGHHQPYWTKHVERDAYPALKGDVECDVVVMGGGIAGMTAAALLYEHGKRVVLIEMNEVAGGTTGHSTGHLDTATDADFQTLARKWGQETVLEYVDAKYEAIDTIERLDREYGLACDFVRYDGFVYAEPSQDVEGLRNEIESCARLHLAYPETPVPLPFPVALGMRLPRNARMDPLKYTVNLAKALAARGVMIFENTRMEEAIDYSGRVVVKTNRGSITADAAILMGHAPMEGPGIVDARVRPWQSYAIAVRVGERIPDGSYYDFAEPYHYTRWAHSDEPDVLIIGGADHPTGQDVDAMQKFLELEDYACRRYRVYDVTHRWSHEFWENADGMPFIGRAPGKQNVLFATGFSGEGLTFGAVAAMVLADLALGHENELAATFDPKRGKLVAQAAQLASATVEAVKGLVVDRAASDVASVEAIQAGNGAVVRVEGEQLAVYRDDAGDLHALSPVCRHMGCIVHFNNAERTWDCPCHGARYDVTGKVIMGPARDDLIPKPLPAAAAEKTD